jgi:hypothetical protein
MPHVTYLQANVPQYGLISTPKTGTLLSGQEAEISGPLEQPS